VAWISLGHEELHLAGSEGRGIEMSHAAFVPGDEMGVDEKGRLDAASLLDPHPRILFHPGLEAVAVLQEHFAPQGIEGA
jgi:hypothetical protein